MDQERLRVKKMALDSKNSVTRISAINLLALYGNEGIKDITEIIELPDSDELVKQHGLNAITWFRIYHGGTGRK